MKTNKLNNTPTPTLKKEKVNIVVNGHELIYGFQNLDPNTGMVDFIIVESDGYGEMIIGITPDKEYMLVYLEEYNYDMEYEVWLLVEINNIENVDKFLKQEISLSNILFNNKISVVKKYKDDPHNYIMMTDFIKVNRDHDFNKLSENMYERFMKTVIKEDGQDKENKEILKDVPDSKETNWLNVGKIDNMDVYVEVPERLRHLFNVEVIKNNNVNDNQNKNNEDIKESVENTNEDIINDIVELIEKFAPSIELRTMDGVPYYIIYINGQEFKEYSIDDIFNVYVYKNENITLMDKVLIEYIMRNFY